MGILTNFVIADPSEAKQVCASSPSEPMFQWFETKGVTEPEVAALWAATFGQPFDPAAPWPDTLRNTLAIRGEDGPGVCQVPPDLVERLAEMDEAGLVTVAERWAAGGLIRPDGARHVVQGLADLCRRARSQGKAVLLSVCL